MLPPLCKGNPYSMLTQLCGTSPPLHCLHLLVPRILITFIIVLMKKLWNWMIYPPLVFLALHPSANLPLIHGLKSLGFFVLLDFVLFLLLSAHLHVHLFFIQWTTQWQLRGSPGSFIFGFSHDYTQYGWNKNEDSLGENSDSFKVLRNILVSNRPINCQAVKQLDKK